MTQIVRILARMNVGGPARQVIELAMGLRKHGFETTIATGEPQPWEGDLRGRAEELGLRIVRIPGLGPRVNPFQDARALANLTRWLRRERPALVHTHTAKAGLLGRIAARAAGIPVRVHTFHGTVFGQYFGNRISRVIAGTEARLSRTTDRIVAVSHATADEVEAIGIDKSKIRVIEPVINLAPYLAIRQRSGALRAQLGVPDDALLIGWIGRLVDVKDPATFVEATSILAVDKPTARFVMLGAGPLEGALREQVSRLGLGERLTILGFQSDMTAVYSDLDFLVSSSKREGMQVTVLEAMAAGVLPIATAVGGASELIADGRSGFLLPPGDPRALAKLLYHAVDQPPGDLLTQRAVGRVRARERFGLERGLDRHAQLYREILEPIP